MKKIIMSCTLLILASSSAYPQERMDKMWGEQQSEKAALETERGP